MIESSGGAESGPDDILALSYHLPDGRKIKAIYTFYTKYNYTCV